jgi:hypothetical protein
LPANFRVSISLLMASHLRRPRVPRAIVNLLGARLSCLRTDSVLTRPTDSAQLNTYCHNLPFQPDLEVADENSREYTELYCYSTLNKIAARGEHSDHTKVGVSNISKGTAREESSSDAVSDLVACANSPAHVQWSEMSEPKNVANITGKICEELDHT